MFPSQPNQSLMDGLACLQAVAAAGRPVGVRELGRQLEIEPSRVNRFLKTLAGLGMTQQMPNRKYVPGPNMHVLAAQSLYASGLLRAAMEPLEGLQSVAPTVALGVRWQASVCYLYHWNRGMKPADALGRVELYPAAWSSIGRVLLSQCGTEEIEAMYEERVEPPAGADGARFEPMDRAALIELLAAVASQGYAAVRDASGRVTTVAVPVGDPAHAGIAAAGGFDADSLESVVAALREASARIESATGLTPADGPG